MSQTSARASKKKLRELHDATLEVVGRTVREWDPYTLLATGSPSDEFDSEIRAIARLVPRIRTERDAIAILSKVFGSSFVAEDFTPDSCEKAGRLLFSKLVERGVIS